MTPLIDSLRIKLVAGALMVLCWALAQPAQAAETKYVIITHPSASIEGVSASSLDKLFRSREKSIPGLPEATPVNQSSGSPIHEKFCEAVHDKSSKEMKRYWAKEIFSGRRVPPREMSSDTEVIEFVAAHPGAIGYVSKGAANDRVKVLKLDAKAGF